jgi:SAM-dependent methyltransferase
MLCQDLGDWTHNALPPDPVIWVAGCGTNQAICTALNFPRATVVGSDLSPRSLELCGDVMRAMGIRNLELRQESINQVDYRDRFDLVICTGVIHHTADPLAALRALACALKPSGILELMVYNRFHRIPTSAAQNAIRLMMEGADAPDLADALGFSRRIVEDLPAGGLLAGYLAELSGRPDAMVADTLLQPVEYSYTVASLAEMAGACDLELSVPCVSDHDKAAERLTWNMDWRDAGLSACYDRLEDRARWQITNLLQMNASPMLWFYLVRHGRARRSEMEIAESFLDTCFERTGAAQRQYVLQKDGGYVLSPNPVSYQSPPARTAHALLKAVHADMPMRTIFRAIGLSTDFRTANAARVCLATFAFPHLRAVQAGAPS